MAMIDPVVAEILKSQGRLEAQVEMLQAQVEMLMCEKEDEPDEEDESEGEGEGEYEILASDPLSTNPALYSNQLEFDISSIF